MSALAWCAALHAFAAVSEGPGSEALLNRDRLYTNQTYV